VVDEVVLGVCVCLCGVCCGGLGGYCGVGCVFFLRLFFGCLVNCRNGFCMIFLILGKRSVVVMRKSSVIVRFCRKFLGSLSFFSS